MFLIYSTAFCVLFYVVVKLCDNTHNTIKFHAKLYSYYVIVNFVCGVLLPYFFIKGKKVENGLSLMTCFQSLIKVYGNEYHLENDEHLNVAGSAVIISNHQTSLDLLGMPSVWHKVKRVVGTVKKEFKYFGPPGCLAYLCDSIFIDRKSSTDTYKVLEEAIERLKHDEIKIWVFPEGTRNKTDAKLLPFKRGAFMMAIAAQVPIIPIVYSPYYFINEKKRIFLNGGKTIMRCLPPVSTTGMTLKDVPELRDRLHKLFLDHYEELLEKILQEIPASQIVMDLK